MNTVYYTTEKCCEARTAVLLITNDYTLEIYQFALCSSVNGLGIMGHVVKRAQGADGNPRDRVAEQMVTEGNSKMFTPALLGCIRCMSII